MSQPAEQKRPIAFAILLIVVGVIGWIAAFALTVEKFALLTDPQHSVGCDFSVLVQCSANLNSWQGSLFGFPNPIIGLGAWIAPIIVGVALLAGARFDSWFWITFNVGVALALVFVIWLISQSIFVLGTLCPWCMVTWSVTIPLFWALTLRNFSTGVIPGSQRMRSVSAALYRWTPTLTVATYLVVAVLAQLRLDVINHL